MVGIAATVTVSVFVQPAREVYEISEVPKETPVINPVGVIVATPGDVLVHVPPVGSAAHVVVFPMPQINVLAGVIAGTGSTLAITTLEQPDGKV